VAEREARLAMAHGNIAAAKQSQEASEKRYVELQGDLRKDAESALDHTKQVLQGTQNQLSQKDQALAQKDLTLAEKEAALAEEKLAREQAEAEASAAVESLKKIAAVKEDERGLVITLSGEVLFETGKATLLPLARQRLEQVATALKDNSERTITILGHTDSRGSDSLNLRLSQERADAVRQFMVGQNIEPSRIRAVGKGELEPIATNENPEGRANNRRVEIVLGEG
jgi:outer membrane protein OmpA-like peptidoglycan-associated protein